MARKKILVVDESPVFLKLIDRYLTKIGCAVDSAEDLVDAQRFLLNNQYDLLIVDLQMPQNDGEKLCQQFKEKYPKLPLILLLNPLRAKVESDCYELADGQVYKPLKENELVKATANALNIATRKKVRIAVDLSLKIDRQQKAVSAISSDMTTEGVYIHTTLRLEQDEPINLKLRLAGDDLCLEGKVIRVSHDKENGLYGAGIKFVKMTMITKRILETYLQNFLDSG